MPPRLNVLSLVRAIPYRPKPQLQRCVQPLVRLAPPQCRAFSDAKDPPNADRSGRIDTEPLPHVSEEAAKTAEIMGETGPDVTQGTPVTEVVKDDKEAQEKLPKVMQDAIKANTSNSTPKGSRSYSTSTTSISGGDGLDMGLIDFMPQSTAPVAPGTKYGLPSLPLPQGSHVKHRYDPVLDQVTNLLMRHGEKSVAQRNMGLILQHLRTSPIPTINPNRPLLPGAPPPSHLPLNPALYLTLAIDSVAPLFRIKNIKGAAGGGVALPIPVPLGQRQRRRIAVDWILTAASKRKSKASGKGAFAQKVAEELINVVEGRSSVWDRRGGLHKQGVAARANIVLPRKR